MPKALKEKIQIVYNIRGNTNIFLENKKNDKYIIKHNEQKTKNKRIKQKDKNKEYIIKNKTKKKIENIKNE